MKNDCEDANLSESSVSTTSFLFFMKLALLSITTNSFLFKFLCMYLFYMHIVLKVRNSSESKALAHSHLISRQSALVQKDSFTNLLAQRACVPCMSTNVCFLKKCAERSHFRAEFKTLLILFYRYFKYLLKSMYFRLRGILGFSVYTCLVVMPRQQLSK